MKSVISVIAIGFWAHVSFASGVSLVCDAVSQTSQAQIESGKVMIKVSGDVSQTNHNQYFYNDGYTFIVNWQEDSSRPVLKSPAFTCGVDSAASKCRLQQNAPNLPFSVFEACDVGAFDTRGLPHQKFSSRLTLDYQMDHGFFYCAANDETPAAAKHLELSHCTSN